MTRVAEETDPMDLSEAPITGGHPAREVPARAKYVIVGSGFAGLCMAIKLKQAGRDDFVILEKGDDVGGTWRENTYPGGGVRHPVASLLVLVRAEPQVEPDVRPAAGDPGLPAALRARVPA
ncbi:cation diffusion facilitator CzcD-associated flavoprotein CzcO [Catenulispora sp. MAP5-51]|uniref:NAD(P)-binding protein n=1 Tax=Catenulispora sp. MAP5-51 TaxID=3156298 RepID=UPI0035120F39